MPIIFDVLYREFCRARLAEMRKQLLLWPGTPEVPEENCEAGHPDDAADRGHRNGIVTRKEVIWKEVKGKVKEKWGKLTDDDLTAINGQRDQLEGRLQQRYGYAKDQTRKEVDTWFASLK